MGSLALEAWSEADWQGLSDVAAVLREAGGRPRRREMLELLARSAEGRDLGPLLGALARRVEELAREGAEYDEVACRVLDAVPPVEERILEAYASDPARLSRALDALARLRMDVLVVLGRVYARLREEAIQARHLEAIRELSTPVIPIWEQVLVLPVIGVVDAARARQLMERLLEQIVVH